MVLAGCPLYVLLTQVNTLDMALTFFLSAAVFAFALGRYYLFWAACALAVLSKGLIGIVLPGGAIGLYVLLRRDWALLGRMKILAGGGLFLLISAPWFIAASAANPEFFHFFFVQEHFERFTTKMHGRYQPMWYFVPILAFGIAPWLLPFVASLKSAFRRELGTKAFDAALFLWLWIGLVFAFFSVSGSKLPSYVLPLFPALALLLGRTLSAGEWRWLLTFQTALAALVGLALGAWASSLLARFGLDGTSYAAVLSWSGLGLATAASIALALALARRKEAAVFMLSLASLGCTVTAVDGHQVLSRWFSISAQAAEIEVPPQARMFAVDYYDHTLPWYFRRLVTMVRYKDELGQPIGWEAGKFLPELADFARAWRDAPAAYAVFSTEKFPQLRKEIGVPMDVVSSGPRYTIVRKP
jgi:4-amino-4-deoxy-L-arabinose transferase-like glycosyltransferase